VTNVPSATVLLQLLAGHPVRSHLGVHWPRPRRHRGMYTGTRTRDVALIHVCVISCARMSLYVIFVKRARDRTRNPRVGSSVFYL